MKAAALALVLLLAGCTCQPAPVYRCFMSTCGEVR